MIRIAATLCSEAQASLSMLQPKQVSCQHFVFSRTNGFKRAQTHLLLVFYG
jgi:hypothetical protein